MLKLQIICISDFVKRTYFNFLKQTSINKGKPICYNMRTIQGLIKIYSLKISL